MHETAIAQDLIETAKKQGDVTGMTVEVGELAHIPAKDLEPTLAELCPWPVEMIEVESKVKCTCGFSGRPKILDKGHDHTVWACPECENLMPKALSGDQIILTKVDVI